jgi:hypothetical protein
MLLQNYFVLPEEEKERRINIQIKIDEPLLTYQLVIILCSYVTILIFLVYFMLLQNDFVLFKGRRINIPYKLRMNIFAYLTTLFIYAPLKRFVLPEEEKERRINIQIKNDEFCLPVYLLFILCSS